MIKANQVLKIEAEKNEQARAISKTQNPMARGEEARIRERDKAINKADEDRRSIWKERNRT